MRRPDIPGEEDSDIGSLEQWLDRDMRGGGDRPEAVFVALEDGEVLGYAKLAFSEETAERSVPRPHRRQARAPRPRHRRRAEGGSDRPGEGAGIQHAPDLERGRNAPIRHLNAKHGYVLEPGVVIVRRSLVAT